jgi:hypothetical protein
MSLLICTGDGGFPVGLLFENDIFTRAGCKAGIPLYDDDTAEFE